MRERERNQPSKKILEEKIEDKTSSEREIPGDDKEVRLGEEGKISKEEIETQEEIRRKEFIFIERMLTNEIISNGLDLVPFAGGGKMLVESAYGKTLSGKELRGKYRVIHGIAGSASILADFSGGGAFIPITGRTVRWLELAAEKLTLKGVTRSAKIFEVTANFLKKNPELINLVEKRIEVALNQYIQRHGHFSQKK